MFKCIMIPVDLQHTDRMARALRTGVDLAKLYGAEAYLVSVTAPEPSAVAHNPEEFARKLQAYTAEQSKRYGVAFKTIVKTAHDPVIDLDKTLTEAAAEIGADLVVMASHIPNMMDRLFTSNAGYLAAHVDLSVFVVR